MSVKFHPDAAKRFDELGAELLKRVVESGAVESPKPGFRPELYPMAQIGEGDVIGEVRVTRSVLNGIQEEIGRLFEKNKAKFGLIDEGYKALTKLATQIQTTAAFRDSITVEFIRDLIFDWVVRHHGQSESMSLAAFVLQEANLKIRDYEVWIPIHQFYIENPLSLGGVIFRTVTGEMMEGWQAKARVPEPGQGEFVQEFFNRVRSRTQGCAAGSVSVRAEKTRAVETARIRTERAVAFLRFFSPVNWTPKLRSYCVPLGSENVVQTAELFIEGGTIVNYSRGILDRRQKSWVLANSLLEQFPGLVMQLSRLLEEGKRTSYQETLRDALLLYSRNSLAVEPADKLVYILVALESILIQNETEPVTKNLGERMAFLIGKDVDSRRAIIANVSETYRLRSGFIHHGNSVEDLETLSMFMVNAWSCLHNLVFHQDRLSTKEDLITTLENRKLA